MLSKRLFTFFVILPLVIGSIIIDSFINLHNIPFFVITLAVQAILTIELLEMSHYYFSPLFDRDLKDGTKPRISFDTIFIVTACSFQYFCIWLRVSYPSVQPIQNFFGKVNLEIILPLTTFTLFGMSKLYAKEYRKTLSELMSFAFILIISGYIYPFFLKIKSSDNGIANLFFFCSLNWGNDALAYAMGMLFGKHKAGLPASPNKSIEGFIGGVAGSWIILLLFHLFAPANFLLVHNRYGVLITIVISFLCPTSDLIESVMKRSAGIKNSGNIMPGRGGVFDSIDSLLFTAPIFYFLCILCTS